MKEENALKDVPEGRDPSQRLVVRRFAETVVDFLSWVETEHRERPNTYKRLAVSFVSLRTFFADRIVNGIGAGEIEDFKVARRKNGIKEITIRHDLHALSKIFRYAIKKRWATQNPVQKEDIPSDQDAIRIHVLTDAEERVYFSHVRGDLYNMGRLMLNQGCRPEEILQLRQEDVDLENRQLFIRRGKTRAARRTLTLTHESMHVLASKIGSVSD